MCYNTIQTVVTGQQNQIQKIDVCWKEDKVRVKKGRKEHNGKKEKRRPIPNSNSCNNSSISSGSRDRNWKRTQRKC